MPYLRKIHQQIGGIGMDKKNAETRNKLKQISSVEDFEQLIECTMLSEEERNIVNMYYRDKKSMQYIADVLGMSESSVKKKHKNVLMKVGKTIQRMEG